MKSLDRKLKAKAKVGLAELLALDSEFKESHGLGLAELLEIARRKESEDKAKEIKVPLEIFRQAKAGSAEMLCKYLKENEGLRYSEIAKLINRDQRTVALNYKNAVKKKKEKIVVKDKMFIPLKAFSDKKLSTLESSVHYMREKYL